LEEIKSRDKEPVYNLSGLEEEEEEEEEEFVNIDP
jgi:hypothetical protein